MRAIAFALLAIGAEYAVQSAKGSDEGTITFKLVIGVCSGLFAVTSLILAIMGL